jgi:hypothetical protein
MVLFESKYSWIANVSSPSVVLSVEMGIEREFPAEALTLRFPNKAKLSKSLLVIPVPEI